MNTKLHPRIIWLLFLLALCAVLSNCKDMHKEDTTYETVSLMCGKFHECRNSLINEGTLTEDEFEASWGNDITACEAMYDVEVHDHDLKEELSGVKDCSTLCYETSACDEPYNCLSHCTCAATDDEDSCTAEEGV